ncbi:MAG: methyltransferase domain-containing protein [Chthoniobacterales bacterium]|nr:methyltransferase domain-containing protein [Chthoniobacterales bacterium]
MKKVTFDENWPESWKSSYFYDLEEVYGPYGHLGYAYAYKKRRRETLRLLTEVLEPGARVLDVAAAQGNFSLTLAEMGYEITWNDRRAELADYVRLKHDRGKISYAPGDAFDLDLPHLFDAALITEIIEHTAHPDQFLMRMATLVRPGGYLIMTTPNGAYFRNYLPKFSDCPDPAVYEAKQFKPDSDGHIFLLHPEEIEPLARSAGLELERFELMTNPLTSGHMKTKWLLQVAPKSLIGRIENLTSSLPPEWTRRFLTQIVARFRKPLA